MARELRNLADFEAFMHDIDAGMQRDSVPNHLQEIVALSEAAKLLEMELACYPRKDPPTPGVYTADDLSGHIFKWVRDRYGDRPKFDFSNGHSVARTSPRQIGFCADRVSVYARCKAQKLEFCGGRSRICPSDG